MHAHPGQLDWSLLFQAMAKHVLQFAGLHAAVWDVGDTSRGLCVCDKLQPSRQHGYGNGVCGHHAVVNPAELA